MPQHTPKFSHEYDVGPSGPARSYWDIYRGPKNVLTVCLHPRGEMSTVTCADICHALDKAFEAGRVQHAVDVRKVLGL